MANVSAYSAKALLDWTLGGAAAPTDPSTRAIGLSLGVPTSISGSEMATNSGYTRKTATFAAAASPAGTATLALAVTFGPFQTTYSITGVQVWDTLGVAVDAGNMLWYGNLATARTVASGDSLVIASGAMTVSLA